MRADSRILVAALLVVALTGCTEVEPGIVVELSAEWVVPAPLEFQNDRGIQFRVDRGALAFGNAELVDCQAPWPRIPVLPDMAVGHVLDSPTHIGQPVVLSMENRASHGAFTPPPASYCRLIVGIFPADDDAVGVATLPIMNGKTVWLEGQWQDATGTWNTFAIESTLATERIFDLDLDQGGLQLEASGKVQMTLRHDIQAWFTGIDPTQDDLERAVLGNLGPTMLLDVSP